MVGATSPIEITGIINPTRARTSRRIISLTRTVTAGRAINPTRTGIVGIVMAINHTGAITQSLEPNRAEVIQSRALVNLTRPLGQMNITQAADKVHYKSRFHFIYQEV